VIQPGQTVEFGMFVTKTELVTPAMVPAVTGSICK